MEYGLTQEQADIRAAVADFARAEIAPVIGDFYQKEEFPYDIITKLGDLGVFGLPFPDEVGGCGGEKGDFFAFCLALEELARVDSSVAITVEAAVGLGAMPIYRFGTPQQRQQWLPDLLTGRALAAFGLTEAGAGTDAGGTRTTARRDGDTYIINGSKAFITNSGTTLTSLVTVTARIGDEISTLIVPSGTPGLTIAPHYSKVGWLASDTHGVSLSDCRVPAANLLGDVGRGYAQFLQILDEGRIAIAAVATGLAQGCVDESTKYATTRHAFGKPIGANQAVAFQIADMAAAAHTARLSWHDAARRMQDGVDFKTQAAIAKLHASDAAVTNARTATQVHGGYGFMNEYPVARAWRDCKILEIGEGTNEVQRYVIARSLGLPVNL